MTILSPPYRAEDVDEIAKDTDRDFYMNGRRSPESYGIVDDILTKSISVEKDED